MFNFKEARVEFKYKIRKGIMRSNVTFMIKSKIMRKSLNLDKNAK